MTKEKQAESRQTNKEKQAKQEQSNKRSRPKKYVRRIIPVWAKLLIIIILSFFALAIGLMIGFSALGDGSPLDVLKLETWEHIVDFVRVNEEE
ncbi:DNA-directed RNA polymerase subunit beta [Gracilibacillus alcaliphilus]|uniref:DNA-directed RNA polymerase subunit beta n=1 Tax=Gracilibacillus alcaliphilus TaxID=1401441 RepID=UPI00195F002A|nr:DNA-directed RNA polymerase subunit beta [Gracilibacillus alcaliphilus]MBM7679730.1 lipopolysaccharide/colanic/teichoic acid biosynthesis glycosyltransferase [Gracilibacillus alcaliphilus]